MLRPEPHHIRMEPEGATSTGARLRQPALEQPRHIRMVSRRYEIGVGRERSQSEKPISTAFCSHATALAFLPERAWMQADVVAGTRVLRVLVPRASRAGRSIHCR
jgi:hypothetical protein